MAGHDELIELLGVYALDAVTPEERRLVDAHLAVCAQCRAEVLEHLEVAAALNPPTAEAPAADAWDRILAQLDDAGRATPPVPDLRILSRPAETDAGRSAPVERPSGGADRSAGRSPLRPFDDAGRPARRPARWTVAVLGAAAAIVVAVLATGWIRADRRADDVLARPAVEVAADQALAAPDSRQLVLTSATSSDRAVAVLTPDGDGYLLPDHLPALTPDRTYQLWSLNDAGAVSLGVLGSQPGTTAFHLQGPVRTLALTEEQAGGVPAPTGQPVLQTA